MKESELVEALVELRVKGLDVIEVVKAHNSQSERKVLYIEVKNILREHPDRFLLEEVFEERTRLRNKLIELYKTGLTIKEIAKENFMTYQTAYGLLYQHPDYEFYRIKRRRKVRDDRNRRRDAMFKTYKEIRSYRKVGKAFNVSGERVRYLISSHPEFDMLWCDLDVTD